MSEPKPSSTKSRVFPWIVAGWGLLLLVLAVWSARSGQATVPDQTTVDSAKKTIETVVQQVSGQLPAEWSVVDEGYAEKTCDLTLALDGVEVRRTLALSGPAGSETVTLSRIASNLDGAILQPGEGTPERFYQDAGNYVSVRGKIDTPGQIRVALDSGCRAR